jgi:pimeloyl-ACP methyl ester carboxylesterase
VRAGGPRFAGRSRERQVLYRGGVKALLIHGLSSNSSTWWRVRDALENDGWDVTTPDLRGHGTADRADRYALEDYAGDLPDGPWDLIVGHSLGGAIAVLRATTTRQLVLLDPVLEVKPEDFDAIKADQLAELELTPESIRASKPLWSERDLDLKITAIAQVDPTAVERSFSDNLTWNVLDAARAITVPTLILGADPTVSSLLPITTGEALAAANPMIEYRLVEGAGHSVHRDRPEVVIAALRALPA